MKMDGIGWYRMVLKSARSRGRRSIIAEMEAIDSIIQNPILGESFIKTLGVCWSLVQIVE